MYSDKNAIALNFSEPQVESIHFLRKGDAGILSRIVRWSWIVLGISSVLQCVFWWSFANILAVGCVALAWKMVTNIFLRPVMLEKYPLSSFCIIGFTCTQFYCPLVFTLLEGKELVFNLNLPYDVFLHSILALFTLIFSHEIYRTLSKRNQYDIKGLPKFLRRSRLFDVPTDAQIWLMGILGLSAMYYVCFYSPSIGHEVTGPVDKFIQGLIPFTYAPFFIAVGQLYGRKQSHLKVLLPKLAIFTVLLFIISIGRNSRGAFMFGFTSVGLAFGLGLLLGVFRTRLFTIRNLLIVLTAIWLFAGPIADLGTAMVMVRGQRGDVSRSNLVDLTMEAFKDKEAIQLYKQAVSDEEQDWDESYLNNIFLARFCNLKFNDASLINATKINDHDGDMLNFSINSFIATLPSPLIDAFHIDINKNEVNSYSVGDYLFYKAIADDSVLGTFRVGHFSGTGMATFGWWYLFFLGLFMIPVFYLFDLFVIKKSPVNSKNGIKSNYGFQFSLCGLLVLTTIFLFLPNESLNYICVFLLRDWIQMVFLYFLIFSFTKILTRMVSGWRY
jgi:hypothetical protein